MAASTYTTLQAINAILRGVGQTTLSAYPSATPSEIETQAGQCFEDAQLALSQKEDFPWSTMGTAQEWEKKLQITADGSGNVIVVSPVQSSPVLRVALHPEDANYGRIQVELRTKTISAVDRRCLFNVSEDTFNFGAAAVVTLTAALGLDFDEFPPPAQRWIIGEAKVRLGESVGSSEKRLQLAMEERAQAWGDLFAWNLRNRPRTVFGNRDMWPIRNLFPMPY